MDESTRVGERALVSQFVFDRSAERLLAEALHLVWPGQSTRQPSRDSEQTPKDSALDHAQLQEQGP